MGRNGFKHALTVLALVLPALALAQRDGRRGHGLPDDAPPVLRKAFSVAFKLRYSGERRVTFRRGSERRSHTEYVIKDGRRIRIWFPSDSPMAGQVIVENGRERRHLIPAKNEIHVGPSMHDDAFEKLRSFVKQAGDKRFRIQTAGNESIAGRKTSLVTFSTAQGNVIQKLWIDDHTGLIMKRQMLDPSGNLVGEFEFVRVNFSPNISSEDFEIRSRATVLTQTDLARRLMTQAGMVQAFLPEDGGRKLIASRLLDRNPSSVILILTYDNGRSQLSLIQAKGALEASRLKWLARDEFTTYTWQERGRTFALIGAPDRDDLKRLADKLVIRPES